MFNNRTVRKTIFGVKCRNSLYLSYSGIGGSVGELEGIKFFFHTSEKDVHHKAHIHCEYSGVVTRIEIETLKVLDKPFKKPKMDFAIQVVQNNKEALLNYWNRVVVNGESLKFKLEL